MSGSARKRSSKWDFKEDFHHPRGDAKGNDYSGKSGYFHEKDLELGHIHTEANGRNGSRRSAMDDDEQLRNKHEIRQHSGEPWPRVSRNGDGMIANYDSRKSSVLDECRQQNSRQSPEKRIHRSRSRSMSRSRSRSRSPFHGVRRDSGFYDRRKNRPRVSPQSGRDFDGRYRRGVEHQSAHQGDQGDELGWEAKSRKARDAKYYLPDDSRERPTRGGRSTEFITNFPEDNSRRETLGRHLHDGTSDGVVRRHRNDFIRERESHRRDGDAVLVNSCEGQVHKNSDIPCRFFAAGYCRNGNHCRFSHHVATRRSPEKRSYDDRFRQDSNRSETEKFYNGRKWNMEISDTGKSSGIGTNSVNTGTSEPKVNGNWLDDMEMSPDWNYGVQSLNNALKEENGQVAQSSQSLGPKDSLVVAYKHGDIKEGWTHGSAGITQNLVTENCYLQQDRSHQGANLYSHNGNIVVEKPLSSNHDPNNLVNIAPVQSFNQNSQNHGALPYESSAALRGSQMPITIDHSGGLGLSNSENVKVFQESNTKGKLAFGDLEPSEVNTENFTTQNTVTRDQLSQISNISASLAQLFGNGQQLPQLYSTLNSQNAMQPVLNTSSEGYAKPESLVVIQPNQAAGLQMHNDPMNNCIPSKGHEKGTGSEGVPVVTTAVQINMTDAQQNKVPDNSVSSALLHTSSETGHADRSHEPAGNPKASEENSDKKADESKRWQDEKNTNGEKEDAENVEGDEKADENKKGKDPKGMRAFKFALVEIVKELLKPAWKEGRMGRDAYKNIVKKVVDKVTGTMQGGNPPQTQEKIDHYLSSSKPKLTKLVQAYVNKYQKS